VVVVVADVEGASTREDCLEVRTGDVSAWRPCLSCDCDCECEEDVEEEDWGWECGACRRRPMIWSFGVVTACHDNPGEAPPPQEAAWATRRDLAKALRAATVKGSDFFMLLMLLCEVVDDSGVGWAWLACDTDTRRGSAWATLVMPTARLGDGTAVGAALDVLSRVGVGVGAAGGTATGDTLTRVVAA